MKRYQIAFVDYHGCRLYRIYEIPNILDLTIDPEEYTARQLIANRPHFVAAEIRELGEE